MLRLLNKSAWRQIYQNTIGAAFDEIKALLPADGIGIYSSTWLTAKLIEQDKLARSLVKETVDAGTYTAIEKKLSDVDRKRHKDRVQTGRLLFDDRQ